MTTDQQKQILRMTCEAIIEAAQAAGTHGAPSGTIYAALMAYGMKLDLYERIIAGLVSMGKIRKNGHLLFAA